MMGRPEFPVSHARAHAAQDDRVAVVGHVNFDLFERAAGQERRGGADERNEAAVGQSRRNADHVLLGDADIDQPIRKRLLEADEVARSDAVVADRDDAFVALGQVDQRLGEGDAAIEGRRRRDNGGVHHTSSFSASSTCSGDGAL